MYNNYLFEYMILLLSQEIFKAWFVSIWDVMQSPHRYAVNTCDLQNYWMY